MSGARTTRFRLVLGFLSVSVLAFAIAVSAQSDGTRKPVLERSIDMEGDADEFSDIGDTHGDEDQCEDAECEVITDSEVSERAITKPSTRGGYKSDLEEAKNNRTATIDFDHFGKVDFSAYGSRKLEDIIYVVVHNGGWNAPSIVSGWQSAYEKNGKSGAAHYTIDRDGRIYQFINDEAIIVHGNAANKRGIGIEMNIESYPLSEPLPNGKVKRGTSCNSLKKPTAEMVDTACSLTDAQYAALNDLVADIIARTSVTLDADHVIGHCEAFGATHGDPKAFDWSRIGLNNQEKKDRVSRLKKEWAGKSSVPCAWYKPY